MKTKLSEIKVLNDLNFFERPISVEEIAKCFYGITDIHYLFNIYENTLVAYVYTLNISTMNISELMEIQKELKADSLSISHSVIPSVSESNGLIYIISYNK